MKRGSILFLCILLAMAFVIPSTVFADESTENLVSTVVESFDPADRTSDWLVLGSKFITEGYPKQIYAEAWPEALWGYNTEQNDYQVLGINARFDRQGYNYLEIIPVVDAEAEEWEHNPIPMKGRVKRFDCWVWGSEYDYSIEMHLMDYNGINWVLPLGNLKYTGWKNLAVEIPNYIPQATKYIPYYKQMTFEKLVIWTAPQESVHEYYVYIDQLKILTDMFESRFDGDTLTWPERVDEM
ncbi:MAG: flagellar filament outer layer protein FlaA [Spirochaetales bacterium]|uniref:Flagellar filament outer layer protein FlaA n=1 Tax=Candidatus Thalassospirochaeta sargassi TaxID=3119039 RepID=A0AAJ1IFM1_9SPIO|nr:flagellar filament outer layer protein FlaA [Spirochaetales bacterium]